MFEQVRGDFGNDTSCQTRYSFCQKPLKVAPGSLKLMKHPLNALTSTIQQGFKTVRMLDFLVFALGCDSTLNDRRRC